MVLWELTLGTAYFLGLSRTYRHALKIQRRIVSPEHPRIRQFLHRRTHQIFDVALRVRKNIQQKDMELGRDLGNWILRWVDQMKPSAAKVLLPKHTEAAIIGEAERLFESTRLMALSALKNIRQRDMELGRNLGNWILRWLDQMEPPSAKVLLPKHTKAAAIIDEAERLFESARLMALKVRKNIQQKDMELGRDLGNWILLRWVDQMNQMKPSSQVLLPKHTEAAIIDEVERLFESARLMALRVRKNIQQKDMEIGRDIGNWILRWLDQMKHTEPSIGTAKRLLESTHLKPQNREVGRHLFMSLGNLQPKLSEPVSMMMMLKPPRPTGSTTQYRNYSESSLVKPIYARGGFDGVIRKDILQWMAQR